MQVRLHGFHIQVSASLSSLVLPPRTEFANGSHFVVPVPDIVQIYQSALSALRLVLLPDIGPPIPADLPSQILVASKMPQQRDFSQRPPRQDDLVKHPRDALDRHRLRRVLVLHLDDEPVRALPEWPNEAPAIGNVEEAVHGQDGVIVPA